MVQALAFAELLLGGIFLVSAFTKEPVGEILSKGITPAGKATLVAKEATAVAQNTEAGHSTGNQHVPFSNTDLVSWQRSDQGVDAQLHPNAPLYALADGIITIAHDPKGFGTNYPVLHLSNGESYYYGHTVPVVHEGQRVKAGDVIARTSSTGQNAPPGWLEFGTWPPSSMEAGKKIRAWLEHLVGKPAG